jgi:crotonobetainyl-CoA:carnitine CoA-transferase CaiB-like acyl-CoA transferase
MFNQTHIEELPVREAPAQPRESAVSGLKVVDFSHFIAGPLATMILGDFGADVIKIERPGRGEDFRYYPPLDPALPAQGGPYLWSNRNKRSLALDIKTEEGVRVALELIATADVVVENFSSGVMERLGLGYERCAELNPRLIYCSISAYGRTGPYADRLGFDPVVQAESGYMSMNGYPDRPGVRSGPVVMDMGTALMASNALLLALLARERTGKGQFVEVSLFDTAVMMTGFAGMQNLLTGKDPQRHGNATPDTCPSGVFRAADRPFYLHCGNDKIFARLFGDVLGRPDIAARPDLVRSIDRLNHREELFGILNEAFAAEPWSHWQAKMRAASVPHGEVRTLGEALRSGEAQSRGLTTRIPHPVKGWIPNIESPMRLSETPAVAPRPAPAVGEHTAEVLRDVLHYDDARIAELERSGALAAAPFSATQAS